MNKNKIIWGIILTAVIIVIVWIDLPYIFSSENLISKNNYSCTYVEANVINFETGKNTKVENKAGNVDKIVEALDNLKVKKTRMPKEINRYFVTFTEAEKKTESETKTDTVFTVYFYDDGVIGFQDKLNQRIKYYKIKKDPKEVENLIEELSGLES